MAQIYFGVEQQEITVGSTFEVGVFLDAHEQPIAAVQSLITFGESLELIDIRDGNSVLSLWLERPHAESGAVAFSGMTPGGFTGARGELFTLVFRALQPGSFNLSADDAKILRNDGHGTAAQAVPAPLALLVIETGDVIEYVAPKDSQAPEPFTPMLLKQDQLGGWVMVFAAQDKGSGLAYYEVKQGWFGWESASSPWLLQDQGLTSSITVKAVDEAGNIRLAKLEATNQIPWYETPMLWGILTLVLVIPLTALLLRRLWGKKRKLHI